MNSTVSKLYRKLACHVQVNYQFKKMLFTSAVKNRAADPSLKNDVGNDKTTLSKDLYMKIKLSGPISVAHYMKQVLTHPTKGYYICKDVFGKTGDFTTSPEISQLFGEMIAIWIISETQKIYNKPFQIVELGPGRGTLSRDILRVFNKFQMSENISLHLVEVSPVLSKIQKETLCVSEEGTEEILDPKAKYYKRGKTENNVEVFWYKSIIDIPQGFTVFLAQEFFDALPIHKFQRTKEGWFEVMVDIDRNSEKEKFMYVLENTDAIDSYVAKDEKRNHIEVSPGAMNIIRYISTAITQNGGFSLIIDYGHDGDRSDTFRAFREHKQCDTLSEPGTADLTADVDFALLKRVARETKRIICYGPVAQKDFLTELGINLRLEKLCENANLEQGRLLQQGYNKIMGSEEMGTCFKVVSMFPYVLRDHLKKFPVHGFQTYLAKEDH